MIISWLIALVFVLRIERIRYTIIAFPMFALMAGYGVTAIRDTGLKRHLVFSVATCSLIISVFAYLPFLQHMSAQNLQVAGAFLNTLHGENVEVFTLPNKGDEVNVAVDVPLLDLFTDKKIYYTYNLTYAPAPEQIAVSKLRFTWTYMNPKYYEGEVAPGTPVAVISGGPQFIIPDSVADRLIKLKRSQSFNIADDIFAHQTLVTVYY